jgi:hypothetical protein
MSKTSKNQEPTGNPVYDFFEYPRTFIAKFVQFIIFLLIIASVALVVIEFFYLDFFEQNKELITIVNYIVFSSINIYSFTSSLIIDLAIFYIIGV